MAARKLRTSAADDGAPLAAWLAVRLALPEEETRRRVVAGGVYVDGARERDPARPLRAGQKLVVHEPAAEHAGAWRVVVLDEGVIVVDKPAGLSVAAERTGGRSLDLELAARYPGTTLFHRIDRETSGLVLFTRRRETRQLLAAALARGEVQRGYVAVVAGAPPDELVLDAPIGPDPADRRRMRAGAAGRPARTVGRVRLRRGGRAVLELQLVTGVTHQLRAHLSGAGWPIVGDVLYGGPVAARLALHAERLAWPGGSAVSVVPAEVLDLVEGGANDGDAGE